MADATTDATHWPRVAVLGAGAIGCYFGSRLALAGAPVTLIARPTHAAAIARRGLVVESDGHEQTIRVEAATQAESAAKADIVLLTVKTTDTQQACELLRPHLKPTAVAVSMQNGVDNAERIERVMGRRPLAAVVYVAASMVGPGRVRYGGGGRLVLGEYFAETPDPERARAVAEVFARAGVPCHVSQDIRAELWTKLVINCAYNAISALARVRYASMMADARIRALMERTIAECVAVARAEGIVLPQEELVQSALRVGETMSQASSSTAQDLARGKATEIDALNGYVVRRAADNGIPVPVNETLHALVKLAETNL